MPLLYDMLSEAHQHRQQVETPVLSLASCRYDSSPVVVLCEFSNLRLSAIADLECAVPLTTSAMLNPSRFPGILQHTVSFRPSSSFFKQDLLVQMETSIVIYSPVPSWSLRPVHSAACGSMTNLLQEGASKKDQAESNLEMREAPDEKAERSAEEERQVE